MAAKFEVYIASKKYPSIKMCETIFPIVGKIQFSEKCIVWNGWLPTKEDVLYTQDDEQIERCVLNGKVVSFDGKQALISLEQGNTLKMEYFLLNYGSTHLISRN